MILSFGLFFLQRKHSERVKDKNDCRKPYCCIYVKNKKSKGSHDPIYEVSMITTFASCFSIAKDLCTTLRILSYK
jgi:hypothetical protein